MGAIFSCGIYWGGKGGIRVALDRKMLDRMLALNDRQLSQVIEKLVREYGLDLSGFEVRPGDMESLRRAIRAASDSELQALGDQLKGRGNGRG